MSEKLNPVDIYDTNDKISNVEKPFSILQNPGDKLSGCVTKTYRKVIKIETDNGKAKYSATQYPNGTVVETKTTKK